MQLKLPMSILCQFKSGIRPLWEEKANRDGGRWTVRVRRHHTDRYWENAIMAMVGEQFLVGDEICGMVLSLRYPWDQVTEMLNLILGNVLLLATSNNASQLFRILG